MNQEGEWVILDSGSDVSLLPSRFQPDNAASLSPGTLQNCQGGSLKTTGVKKAELVAITTNGEEVLLQHDFIVGNVTSCLVSLGQLYQGGWMIHKDPCNGDLSLMSPGDEIRIPVEFRNRSFAIRAHVRQVVDTATSTSMATGGDEEQLTVRTVVCAPDAIDLAPMDSWEMTADGTPFLKTISTNYVDPRDMWGKYWPYRTTLIRKHQGEDRQWTVVEVSAKYMDRRAPFGMIDQFLLTVGFDADCEVLTILGVESQTLLDLGLVVVNESGDVVFGQDDEMVGGLRDELPAEEPKPFQPAKAVSEVLPPLPDSVPQVSHEVEAGEAIEAVPEVRVDEPAESIEVHDGLVVTPTSSIKLLRDACRWLAISQAGSKQRMFNRIQRARDLALKRSMVESAQEQYRQHMPEVHSVPIPPQPDAKDRAEHMMTHTPFQPWCEFCVKSRSRANQHPHVSDPAQDAQREHPTVQCDFFFMEAGKEDAVVALLMVDVWSRYVSVVPLKPRNTQTVGNALVKFLSEVGRVEPTEIAGDNEPVLAAGMRFCQRTRATLGLQTILTWNRTYEKTRTSVAERFVQTVRGLQKTLTAHLESSIQATIPTGHPMVQWAAMHSAWIYNRFHVHSSLRTTPYQSLFGRPYRGRIVCFGQTTFGLDPKADKYRPAWIRGAWLGKDSSDMDLLFDGQSVIKTKAVRRIGEEWDAALVLGVDIIPSQVFGHRQIKHKQTVIPLSAPKPQEIDVEAEAVRDYASDGYSPTEMAEEQQAVLDEGARTWEEAGLENPFSPTAEEMESEKGGGVPITPQLDGQSDDDVEIPSSSARPAKHAADAPPPGEHPKAQRMDDDPTPVPKTKASRTEANINQVAEFEMCHNDESMFPEDFEDDALVPDSEDDLIAGHGESDGPPNVSSTKLQELDEQAALDEVEKLFKMKVIEPVTLTEGAAVEENVVDTTLVYDWRYRDQQWIRRCRIVAREFKTGATDENNFSPTSSFASVRMLLVFAIMYNLAVTALDVKDAFLMVPQVEVLYVKIPMWIRQWTGNPHTHWLLKRCLPGQRNAALRWHQHIGGLCADAGLEAFPGAPTVLRHRDLRRKMFVNIHVDDLLLVCNPGDVNWFQSTVGSTLTMKVDGPHEPGSGNQLMYLKKKITMRPGGILLQPNSTYIPKLVALMKVSGRRKKGLP